MIPASEEHRNANGALEIVNGLLSSEDVRIEQVIAKIGMDGDGIGQQKTKTCPYCGTRVDVRRAKKVASAKNAFEASEKLRDIKSRKGFSRE